MHMVRRPTAARPKKSREISDLRRSPAAEEALKSCMVNARAGGEDSGVLLNSL